ncbi:ectonucleotide pyrophosphatase/phosphodiesterase family member 7-like [Styela clava]
MNNRDYCFTLLVGLSMAIIPTYQYSLEDHHKLLLISFDGLRWDYVDRRPDLESFNILREEGVKAEFLEPPFPSQTSPSHTTLATGLYVESHGVVHNVYYDRYSSEVVTGDFYRTLAINEWWDNGDEPIWITASSQGLKSGGYLFPGSNATIGGRTATRSILQTARTSKEESDWQERIDDVISWFVEDNFDFIALYFEQPDSDGHDKGPDDDIIESTTLPLINRTIGYLLSKVQEAGLTDELNIIIASDHGMTTVDIDVSFNDVISLVNYVNVSDIFFMFPYAALGLVEPYPNEREKVYNQLTGAHPRLNTFYKEDLPEYFHYSNNDRITSIVLTADLGYTMYRVFPGFHINKGEHGYDSKLPDMRASFFAIGPSFKKNYIVPGFQSIHVYELMCHLLGLTPAPNNGSLDVLYPILRDELLETTSFTTTNVQSTTSGAQRPVAVVHFLSILTLACWLIKHN